MSRIEQAIVEVRRPRDDELRLRQRFPDTLGRADQQRQDAAEFAGPAALATRQPSGDSD
jgi:hypothetical protein